MNLVAAAHDYCAKKGVARTVVFSANRFARLIADKDVSLITRDDLEAFTLKAVELGLSKSTIKGTIKDLRSIASDSSVKLDRVTVRVPDPEPEPAPLEDLSAVWEHCAPWLKSHLALTFHCCFRLADILSLQVAGVAQNASSIRLTANKTGRNHSFPVPDWLRPLLGSVSVPFKRSNDWSQVIVRDELARVSAVAGVPQLFPRNVRQAGITAWSKSNGMAGAIAHGSGLSGSVLGHYVSPIHVLESAMPRVTVPATWRGESQISAEDSVLASFRRLDPESQAMVAGMAERLVR